MLPDGNCLFRSLSFCLFNTEDHHHHLRDLLLWFVNFNQSTFQKHLPSGQTIQDHIKKLSHPCSWGTDLEIIVATTYFQIPTYYCCIESKKKQWVWCCVNPLVPTQFRYPVVVDHTIPNLAEPLTSHFELVYWKNTHYDSIVSKLTGSVSREPPNIEIEHSFVAQVIS